MRTEEHSTVGSVGPLPALVSRRESGPLLLAGQAGSLRILPDDKVTRKLAMLYEGQCAGLGAAEAAARFGYTRQGYYKVLRQFREQGATAFFNRPGPKSNYRRTGDIVRAVIRHRFQHPDCPTSRLVSELRAEGVRVSVRSAERIISDYGLQRRSYPKHRARPHRRDVESPQPAESPATRVDPKVAQELAA